jgi:hypothetical protein
MSQPQSRRLNLPCILSIASFTLAALGAIGGLLWVYRCDQIATFERVGDLREQQAETRAVVDSTSQAINRIHGTIMEVHQDVRQIHEWIKPGGIARVPRENCDREAQ